MAWGILFFPYFLCHVVMYSEILHRTGNLPACFLRDFFNHHFSESFIYSKAIFNSLQSKVDTCCLLPCILNRAAFLQWENKHLQVCLRHFGSVPVLVSFQIISAFLSVAVKSRVMFLMTTLQQKFQFIFCNPVFITDIPHGMKAWCLWNSSLSGYGHAGPPQVLEFTQYICTAKRRAMLSCHGVLARLRFRGRFSVFISSVKLGVGRGIVILLGLNHSPLHSTLLKSEHATGICSLNSEMHIFCFWCS